MSNKKCTFCYNFHRHLCNLQAIPYQLKCFVIERSWINEANPEINALREGSHFKPYPLPPSPPSPRRLVTHSFEKPARNPNMRACLQAEQTAVRGLTGSGRSPFTCFY